MSRIRREDYDSYGEFVHARVKAGEYKGACTLERKAKISAASKDSVEKQRSGAQQVCCAWCEEPFQPYRKTQRYCCRACADQARGRRP